MSTVHLIKPKVPIQAISIEGADRQSVSVSLARLDLMHPLYGGNKWFKLKYNLEAARSKGYKKILTFGGAYSNHIYATAAICAEQGFECVGILRGEKILPLNETLSFAEQKGMKLFYLSRSEYENRYEIVNGKMKTTLGEFYEIPDGGCNANGIKGCMEITPLLPDFDYIICDCGTFTTLAGIALSLNENQKAIGISALKAEGIGERSLAELNKISESELGLSLTPKLKRVTVFENYHFGGFAKTNDKLNNFIRQFENKYNICLDHVYTGKMLFALFDMLEKKYFPSGSRVIVSMSGRAN